MMDSIERNKTGSKVEPEYWSTLNSLEKEVGICIQGKGWSPKKWNVADPKVSSFP